jgi:hypothetical protein
MFSGQALINSQIDKLSHKSIISQTTNREPPFGRPTTWEESTVPFVARDPLCDRRTPPATGVAKFLEFGDMRDTPTCTVAAWKSCETSFIGC